MAFLGYSIGSWRVFFFGFAFSGIRRQSALFIYSSTVGSLTRYGESKGGLGGGPWELTINGYESSPIRKMNSTIRLMLINFICLHGHAIIPR